MKEILNILSVWLDMFMSVIMPYIQPLIPDEVSEAYGKLLDNLAPVWNDIFVTIEELFSKL